MSKDSVTQADLNFRHQLLKYIIDGISRPCTDGDTIDDRTDAIDGMISEYRLTSTAEAERQIADLRAENERLQDALQPFADKATMEDGTLKHGFITLNAEPFRAAVAALASNGGEG